VKSAGSGLGSGGGERRSPSRIWWLIAVAALCAPGSCGGGPSPDELVLAYVDAANRHDLVWVREHLAEDVTWDLMGDVLQGRDRVLAPHEQDRVMHTRLEPTLRGVAGDTVVLDVIERNDFITAMGLDSIGYDGIRFVVRDGLIRHIGPAPGAPAVDPFGGATVPFFAWVRQERPEDWAALLDAEGRPRYGEANGRLLMRLARAWHERRP
jgi:hypothetical protein